MNRTPVSSSNIASVGYDSGNNVLEVEFNGGRVYQYLGVPQSKYQGLMSATSHGKYLERHIKGIYSYRRVK